MAADTYDAEVAINMQAASALAMSIIREVGRMPDGLVNHETYAMAFVVAAESMLTRSGAADPLDALRSLIGVLEQAFKSGEAHRVEVTSGQRDN